MICLDSDFIIDFLRGKKDANVKIETLTEESRHIVTTSINVLEIFVGIIGVDGISSERVEKTRDFISNLEVLDFNDKTAERSAHILNSLKKLGKPIGLKDTLIASIVLENNSILLTRNVKHFELVSGLLVESW